MSSTAMPIVWCSDPNSSSKQPIAFALHGIQLEGNITEEHVTALKAMVNAAASGRMILPTDGAMFLMDCGIELSSTIVPTPARKENTPLVAAAPLPPQPSSLPVAEHKAIGVRSAPATVGRKKCDKNLLKSRRISLPMPMPPEPKYSDAPANELSKYDIIYEFLCCAKCMNESTRTEHMPNKMNGGEMASPPRKCSSMSGKFTHMPKMAATTRRRCSDSFLYTSQRNGRISRTRHLPAHAAPKRWQQLKLIAESVPMYAEVNKHQKQNAPAIDSRLSAAVESDKNIEHDVMSCRLTKDSDDRDHTKSIQRISKCLHGGDNMQAAPVVLVDDVGSVDSDDNIGGGQLKKASVNYPDQQPSRKASLDSGFNEMQNKLEKSTIANEAVSRKMSDGSGSSSSSSSSSSNNNGGKCNNGAAIITIPPIIITQPVTEKAEFLPGASEECDVAAAAEKCGDETTAPHSTTTPSIVANLKECLTQSRNRRKSYEEFKAIYHRDTIKESGCPVNVIAAPTIPQTIDTNNIAVAYTGDKLQISDHNVDKIKARRKSYEEFKAMVRECNEKENQITSVNMANASTLSKCLSITKKKFPKTNAEKLTKFNAKIIKAVTTAAGGGGDYNTVDGVTVSSPMAAANCNDSTMHSLTSSSGHSTASSISSHTGKPINKAHTYKENFKIYNQLISYGTIYDIMQKKTDLYKACGKFDTYKTYGTIYEILQRKSDEYDVFRRKRAASEKFIGRRGSESADARNASTRLGKTTSQFDGSMNFGTIYDIIHRRTRSTEQSAAAATTASTAVDGDTQKSPPRCYGKIYDILQNEKSESPSSPIVPREKQLDAMRNRFMVKRISEEELDVSKVTKSETKDCVDEKPIQYSEPQPSTDSTKNVFRRDRVRMRRFSNIVMPSSGQRAGNGTCLGNITENDGLTPAAAAAATLTAEADYLCMDKKPNADERDREKIAVSMENPQHKRHSLPASLGGSPTINSPRRSRIVSSSSYTVANATDQMQNKHNFTISVISRTNGSRDGDTTDMSNQIQMSHTRPLHANTSANIVGNDKCAGTGITSGGCAKDNNKCVGPRERSLKTATKSRRLSEFTRGEFLNEKP